MHINFQYPLSDSYSWFLQVEADCSIDISNGWQETVVQLMGVSLQGCMSIRIQEMPEDLVKGIIEKAITEQEKAPHYNEHIHEAKKEYEQREANQTEARYSI